MQQRTTMQTGSPYNPENQPDQKERPAPLAERPIETLPERVKALAVETTGLPEECFEFPEVVVPTRTEEGLFVTDNRNLVKYNIETGEFSATRKLREMVEVENHNQHAATTVESMILG